MKKKVEDLTGAVSVDGDVTPTLREQIDTVTPTDWSEMSTSNLWEQKSILLTRVQYALNSNHPGMAKQIQRGIATIDAILKTRSEQQDNLLF